MACKVARCSLCGIALFRFLEFFLFHSQQTGNTVLLHGDTVEYAGFFHGTPAVRHQNKLGGICKVLQILCIAADISLVQCRINLVQNSERRRPQPQNGKVNGDRHKGLLSAGKRDQILDDFSRRCDLDLNA